MLGEASPLMGLAHSFGLGCFARSLISGLNDDAATLTLLSTKKFALLLIKLEINECESDPCINEGTCIDQIDSFMCDCVAGWTDDICQTGKYLYAHPPPPSQHCHRTRGYAHSPSPEPPISGKGYTPISGIGYHWQLQKNTPFSGLSREIFPRLLPNIPPFPRKWEYACGPLMHSSGGGGGGYIGSLQQTQLTLICAVCTLVW